MPVDDCLFSEKQIAKYQITRKQKTDGAKRVFRNQKIKRWKILVCFSLAHQANASITSYWPCGTCFSLPLWPVYDHGCIHLGSSLPRKNQTLLTSVDLPITFKTTTVTIAATVAAAINTPCPGLPSLPFILLPSDGSESKGQICH